MKLIPLFKCRDMKAAVAFYTGVLDFELRYREASTDDVVVDLVCGEAVLQLTTIESLFGSVVNVRVSDVDALFAKYLARGLDTSGHGDSPVHGGPLDQTWGIREFYVTDPDGNSLRFGQPAG
jgi:catechol 2,3-dioxygenase-like lactoylglutathione lyase family enzyme